MSYCAQADLLKRIDETTLIALTDDNNVAIDTDVLAAAIADADALIDSYAGSKHSVPMSPVPEVVTAASCDLTLYNLYSRRDLGVPEVRQKRRDETVAWLRDVSKGVVSLGEDDPDGTPNSGHGVIVSDDNPDRLFTRSALKDS